MSGKVAVSLLFIAVACGTPPAPPRPDPGDPPPQAPARADSGQVTLHVKDMTKVLNLV